MKAPDYPSYEYTLPLDELLASDSDTVDQDFQLPVFGITQTAAVEAPEVLVIGVEHSDKSTMPESSLTVLGKLLTSESVELTGVYVEAINVPALASMTSESLSYFPAADMQSVLSLLFDSNIRPRTIDGVLAGTAGRSRPIANDEYVDLLTPQNKANFLDLYGESVKAYPFLTFPILSRYRSQLMAIQVAENMKELPQESTAVVVCGKMHVPLISRYFADEKRVGILGEFTAPLTSVRSNPNSWIKLMAEAEINSPLIPALHPNAIQSILEKVSRLREKFSK